MSLLGRFLAVLLLFFASLIAFSNTVHAAPSIPVLMYHYIRDYHNEKDISGEGLSVSPANFDQEMGYLSSHGYTTISLDTMYAIFNHQTPVPAKPIVLTFDDGYIDFYANAYPILKKYNLHATSFVITGFVGQAPYLSWDNIHELQRSGLITFEAHTVDHAYLPKLSYQAALKELTDSKNTLQSQTGYGVNFIAYPYGASNASVWQAAQKAGFVGGLGTWLGKAYAPTMNMPRVRISGNISLPTFTSKL